MKAMDKIPKDLEHAARWHNSKLYWQDKLRDNSRSELTPVEGRNGAKSHDKKRFEQRWAEQKINLFGK